jgi:D-hydroxyproline dehydrogenase subunit beta
LRTLVALPGLRIGSRWHGVYVKDPDRPYLLAQPEPRVAVLTGLGGAGMTLSFGLAERVVKELLG